MARLIAERTFDSALTDADLAATMERLGPCLEEYGVQWLRSYLSPDRKRMICMFEGADAESVRSANRAAEAPFDHIWNATVLGEEG